MASGTPSRFTSATVSAVPAELIPGEAQEPTADGPVQWETCPSAVRPWPTRHRPGGVSGWADESSLTTMRSVAPSVRGSSAADVTRSLSANSVETSLSADQPVAPGPLKPVPTRTNVWTGVPGPGGSYCRTRTRSGSASPAPGPTRPNAVASPRSRWPGKPPGGGPIVTLAGGVGPSSSSPVLMQWIPPVDGSAATPYAMTICNRSSPVTSAAATATALALGGVGSPKTRGSRKLQPARSFRPPNTRSCVIVGVVPPGPGGGCTSSTDTSPAAPDSGGRQRFIEVTGSTP